MTFRTEVKGSWLPRWLQWSNVCGKEDFSGASITLVVSYSSNMLNDCCVQYFLGNFFYS